MTLTNESDWISLCNTYCNNLFSSNSYFSINLFEKFDLVVFLYKFMHEKDIFERHYQLDLAHRLFETDAKKVTNFHLEKMMVKKLKVVSGFQWAYRLEGMIKDVENSRKAWKIQKNYNSCSLVEPIVCTAGYWPCPAEIPFYSPLQLQTEMEKFKKAWLWKNPGKKLIWHMNKGRAIIEIFFKDSQKKPFLLDVTTYQMMILLIFNDNKIVTFEKILALTGVPQPELGHHLLSLVHPRVHILLKRPNTKELALTHKFKLNDNYLIPVKNSQQVTRVPLLPLQPLRIRIKANLR